jgi:hypothetical protein
MRRRYTFLSLAAIVLLVITLAVAMPVSADPGEGGAGAKGKVNPIPRPPPTTISLGPAWYVYYPMGLKPAADALGMTTEDLSNYLWAGATLAELAESKGIDLQILRDAVDGAMFRLGQGYVQPSPWEADGKAMPIPQTKFVPGGDARGGRAERGHQDSPKSGGEKQGKSREEPCKDHDKCDKKPCEEPCRDHDKCDKKPCEEPCKYHDKCDKKPCEKPCKDHGKCDKKPCEEPCKDHDKCDKKPCEVPCKGHEKCGGEPCKGHDSDPCDRECPSLCTSSICKRCRPVRATASGGLRLRVGPGVSFMVSRVVAYGTRLVTTGDTRRVGDIEWCQVCYQGKKLWAAAYYLEPW